MRRLLLHAFLALATALPAIVLADDAAPAIAPLGEAFIQASWNVSGVPRNDPRSPENGRLAFAATRVSLGAEATFERLLAARVLLAAEPQDGRWSPVAKEAWLDLRFQGPVNLRAGVLPTGWIGFLDRATAFRFVSKSAYERWLAMPETDLGVALWGRFPGGYGSYQVGAYNGDGFAKPEFTKGKAFDLRATFALFQNVPALTDLSFSLYVRYEAADPRPGKNVLQYALLLHWRHAFTADLAANGGAELDFQSVNPKRYANPDTIVNALVLSAFADVSFYRGLGVFVRADYFDPDTEDRKDLHGYRDERWLQIAGIDYRIGDHVAVALDYQHVSYATTGPTGRGVKAPDHVLFLHGRVGF